MTEFASMAWNISQPEKRSNQSHTLFCDTSFMILCECSLPLHPSVVKWIYRFFPDLNVCLYTHMLYVTMIIGSGAMKFSLDPLCIVEIPYDFMSDTREHVHQNVVLEEWWMYREIQMHWQPHGMTPHQGNSTENVNSFIIFKFLASCARTLCDI